MNPPIKWAGGKRWLASTLSKEIEGTNPRLYVEPFVGAGAMALAVMNSIPKILSDVNGTLMDMWRCLQKAPATLIGEVARVEHDYPDTNEGYLKARSEMNSIILIHRPMWIRRAALFLYLNARSFNGLWRTNSTGFFNVPFGKYKNPSSIDEMEAKRLGGFLKNCELVTCDFKETLSRLYGVYKGTKVAVFLDSPYDESFDGYAAGGFSEADQRALAKWFFYLVERGAKVWATNRDTPLIRELYVNARLESVDEMHVVGATGERRGKRSCLLIRGG